MPVGDNTVGQPLRRLGFEDEFTRHMVCQQTRCREEVPADVHPTSVPSAFPFASEIRLGAAIRIRRSQCALRCRDRCPSALAQAAESSQRLKEARLLLGIACGNSVRSPATSRRRIPGDPEPEHCPLGSFLVCLCLADQQVDVTDVRSSPAAEGTHPATLANNPDRKPAVSAV